MTAREEANVWVYQNTCYICGSPFKPAGKSYCRLCRRAICQLCVSPAAPRTGKEASCTRCHGQRRYTKEQKERYRKGFLQQKNFRYPSEYKYEEPASIASIDLSMVPVRRSENQSSFGEGFVTKEMLDGLKLLPESQSSSSVDRFQVSIYDTELYEVKQQIGYYVGQPDKRDSCLYNMSHKISNLADKNQALQDRVSSLEEVLGRLPDRASDISSSPENKSDTCVKCALF